MSERWLNLVDAAEVLGITPEAARMRAKRGSMESEKRSDGRLYVRVVADYTKGEQRVHGHGGPDAALVEQLRSEVEYLRDENRRKDSIIMQMAQRIPELEAAGGHGDSYDASDESYEEPLQGNESSDEGYTSGEDTAAPQTATQRPWWRRIFGG